MRLLLLLFFFSLYLLQIQTQHCDANQYQFRGTYSLGKQDELNRTFAKVQNISSYLSNANKTSGQNIKYVIYSAKPRFTYRDSKQKAEVINNNTIAISGGRLQTQVTFQWDKTIDKTSYYGKGTATSMSQEIAFSKTVVIDSNETFYRFQLDDCSNVTWKKDAFTITRIDPANTTTTDIENLNDLLNVNTKYLTIGNEVSEVVNKRFSQFLNTSLHDEHQPIDHEFEYIWKPDDSGYQQKIKFTRRPVQIDVEPTGLALSYETYIAGYDGWSCGERKVPHQPYNPKVYGQSQNIISYDFYLNVLRYAIDRRILHADLNQKGWGSRMFQFRAGDLYEVLPLVGSKYYADQEANGNCRPLIDKLAVYKSDRDAFNVSISFFCELNVFKEKVAEFTVRIEAQIGMGALAKSLDFRLLRHQEEVQLSQYHQFAIQSPELAKLMIHHSINRLYDGNLFGSGWPLSPPKDYPKPLAAKNFTLIYDSTHIQPTDDELSLDL